ALRARGLFLEDISAAGGLQFVELAGQVLIPGAHPGISISSHFCLYFCNASGADAASSNLPPGKIRQRPPDHPEMPDGHRCTTAVVALGAPRCSTSGGKGIRPPGDPT